MATVATTTIADALGPPTLAPIARSIDSGRLYVVVRTATNTLTVYRSTDSGGSWASYAAFSHTGLQEWSRIVVDRNAYAHLAYRIGDGSADSVWYRRLNLNTATWSSGIQASSTEANGGVIGSRSQGLDLAVVRNNDGSYICVIAKSHTYTNNTYGLTLDAVSVTSGGTMAWRNGLITNKRAWVDTGTPPGRSGVSCEVEHNGDGFTSSTPHLWVAWGRTSLRMVKLSWQGSSSGWAGPSNHQVIRSGIPAQDWAAGRWDGSQWLMPVVSPDDSSAVRIYQRNRANTATVAYNTPVHPAGSIRTYSISYDSSTKDIRVYAVGTSNNDLYFVDYTRSGGVWSSWATVSTTDILGGSAEWGVRAGGTSGNARFDVVTAHSGSPNTVVHTAQTTSSTPDIAVWTTSLQTYFNGGPADVGASLTLDWEFSDPDPGQGQGSYALSRQIGAGTIQYFNAATTTWGAGEVQNASATTQVTLASGWGSGTDDNHTYKVKVWDSANTPSTGYSAPLVLVPSVKVNPTITAPTAAQVINTDRVTVTWTVAEQTAFRLRLLTNPGGVVVHDSDWVSSADTTYTPDVQLPTGTGWTIDLNTRNNERLTSSTVTRNFSVTYAPPPAMRSTMLPVPASGWIVVTPVTIAPTGAQPAIVTAELYRRKAITPALNLNPTFAGNVSDWFQGGGGSAGSLTYSTAQSVSAAGAARYVPPAAGGATAQSVESSSYGTIEAGKLYMAGGWIRPDTANKPVFIALNYYTSGGAFVSSVQSVVSAPIAGAWHYLEVVGDPSLVATAARVRVAIGEQSTPAAADAFYADEVYVQVHNADTGTRPVGGNSPSDPVYDSGAASGVPYEYRWLATGANGTSIYGPWMS